MKHPMPVEKKRQKQKVSNSYSAVILVLQRYVAESPREVDNELALKGLHRLAQGNALGHDWNLYLIALKERNC